jgi:hypothetical protein
MSREKRLKKNKRKYILTGVAITGAAAAAAIVARQRKAGRISQGIAAPRSDVNVPIDPILEAAAYKAKPLVQDRLAPHVQKKLSLKEKASKPSASSRRKRGFNRLTKSQKNRLENNFGYDLKRNRFRPNISKSSRKKGIKLLKSLGRFRNGRLLTSFARRFALA